MEWIKIDAKHFPKKDCLVYLKDAHNNMKACGAEVNNGKIVTVHGHFPFDRPNPTHYMYPTKPVVTRDVEMPEVTIEEKPNFIEAVNSAIAFLNIHHYGTSKLIKTSEELLSYVEKLELEVSVNGGNLPRM